MSDPKYIDAEKLKRHYAWWDNEAQKIFDEIIDLQPAADVVEVVRCKDCKHSRQHDDEFWIEEAPLLCERFDIYVGDDDYCSMGERKNG